MNIETLLVAVSALYAVEYILLTFGRYRSARLPRRNGGDARYHVSVVVAARDEEHTIGACLECLLAQDYPAELTEVIVVNDESSDATAEVIARVAARHPGRVTSVETIADSSHVTGKARAIAQGVDRATGELFLFTDADCLPPPTWIRTVSNYFCDDVDGFGSFTLVRGASLFSRIQHLDWLHLHAIGSGASGLGLMLGVIGNNMAVRRSAYESVGGYRSIPFSVTEDFALFVAIGNRGGRLIFPCDRDASMVTHPCPTIADVIRQKQRWARGGAGGRLFPGGFVLIIAVLMLSAFVCAPFVSPVAWGVVWGTKFLADLTLIIPTARRLESGRPLNSFLLFEFYFLAQAIVTPFLLARRTVVWKGRAYRS